MTEWHVVRNSSWGALLAHGATLLLTALVAGGCSSAEPEAERNYAARLADVLCEAHARCCTGAPDCRQRMRVDMYEPGKVSFDPAAAAKCLDQLKAAYDDCVLEAAEIAGVSTSCAAALTGRRPSDEPCKTTAECASISVIPVDCLRNGDPAPNYAGQCTTTLSEDASLRKKLDETCRYSCDDRAGEVAPWVPCENVGGGSGSGTCFAADGLRCAGDLAAPTCQPLPAVGEACTLACQAGSYCDTDTHLCRQKLERGALCSSHAACRDRFCGVDGCGPLPVIESMLCRKVIGRVRDALLFL